MRCPHCKGTGEAPIKLQQECVGCQRRLTMTFESGADLSKHDGVVYCKECQSQRAAK